LVLASAPKSVTNKLQRVQNAAARLIAGTQKHEPGLSRFLRDDLHWLTIPQRDSGCSTSYSCDCSSVSSLPSSRTTNSLIRAISCVAVFEDFGRQHLCLASRRKLNILRFCRSTFCIGGVSVASPTVSISLSDLLSDPCIVSECLVDN